MQEAFYLSANLRRRNTWSPFHGKCDYVYVVGWGVCNVIESRDIFVDGSLFRPISRRHFDLPNNSDPELQGFERR